MKFNHSILVACCLSLSGLKLMGSGSYIARLPAPATSLVRSNVDREKFGLGQKLFNASVKLEAAEPAAPQLVRLKKLQAKLPESVATKKDLAELAGKLTPQQLDALEYFVIQRYATK
jgi:hypothetical protein